MSKTGSIILKSVLGLLIVFLGVMIFLCINRPQQRESEYYTRRDACGEKLKVIRTLEEAHKAAYGTYCGNFDTLLLNLSKQEQKVMRKEKAENAPDSVYDMPELEAIRKGWIVQKEVYVVPLEKLREDKKLTLRRIVCGCQRWQKGWLRLRKGVKGKHATLCIPLYPCRTKGACRRQNGHQINARTMGRIL